MLYRSYEIAVGFLPRNFRQRSMVYTENDCVEELYLISKGVVSVGFTLSGMKYPILEFGKKAVIGSYYVFKNTISEFYYQAKTDVEVIGINKEYFLSVINNHKSKSKPIKDICIKFYEEKIRKKVLKYRERAIKKFNNISVYGDIDMTDRLICPYEDFLEGNEPEKKIASETEIIDKLIYLSKDLELINNKMNDINNHISAMLDIANEPIRSRKTIID